MDANRVIRPQSAFRQLSVHAHIASKHALMQVRAMPGLTRLTTDRPGQASAASVSATGRFAVHDGDTMGQGDSL